MKVVRGLVNEVGMELRPREVGWVLMAILKF